MPPSSVQEDHAVIEPPSTCALCDAPAEDPLAVLTWALEVEDDDHRWMCLDCARDHVRDIEGRLGIESWSLGDVVL